ncbi:hypothetical protein [Wenzhouxiangella sp. EGI_FJ10305]|uniref:hypothetical protein n=1 Tax=Wenzhouxiangella sp. EGI_FJ10305 TaxID=3243768 RepID=UPI0035DD1A28
MRAPDLAALRSRLGAIRANWRGRSVKGRLVVIESDDWGAIRTPSKAALGEMRARGLVAENSVYCNDALETSDDLERLYEVLSSASGADGRRAVLTANTIMANPDFEAIQASGFKQYAFEPTTATCAQNSATRGVPALWRQGMAEGLYRPQFHGREHLHHRRWLARLRDGDELTRFCFSLGSTSSGQGDYAFMEALDWDSADEVQMQADELVNGLELFREIFGYSSSSFIAPCYTWDPKLDPILSSHGIRWIQGVRVQRRPTGQAGAHTIIRHFFGQRNAHGQRYNVRNVHFEPVMTPNLDIVDRALAQIAIAFAFRRPAVINTHRVNYIGSIEPKNADLGLCALKSLLRIITRRWPDVKFISTDQLSDHLQGDD